MKSARWVESILTLDFQIMYLRCPNNGHLESDKPPQLAITALPFQITTPLSTQTANYPRQQIHYKRGKLVTPNPPSGEVGITSGVHFQAKCVDIHTRKDNHNCLLYYFFIPRFIKMGGWNIHSLFSMVKYGQACTRSQVFKEHQGFRPNCQMPL